MSTLRDKKIEDAIGQAILDLLQYSASGPLTPAVALKLKVVEAYLKAVKLDEPEDKVAETGRVSRTLERLSGK